MRLYEAGRARKVLQKLLPGRSNGNERNRGECRSPKIEGKRKNVECSKNWPPLETACWGGRPQIVPRFGREKRARSILAEKKGPGLDRGSWGTGEARGKKIQRSK